MAMKALPQFYRIGSDPEFLFVTKNEFRVITVPASQVISSNRLIALKSFIGTDNHQATAELRPQPSHNVSRHMYDIAYGLHETDKWLAGHKRHHETKIVAQPFVNDEPLGGHIHCSFFIDEPHTKALQKINRHYVHDRIEILDPEQPSPELTTEHMTLLNEQTQRGYKGELFNSGDFANDLDYLLWPFECAIQPWWDRVRRNGRYGGTNGAGDRIRQNISYPTGATKYQNLAYLHYEYRVPSTWLCHPWLAYSYLGLAKLSMLNVKLIRSIKREGLPKISQNTPYNTAFKEIFARRLLTIIDKGKWSNDLKLLPDIISKCFEARSNWFEVPGQSIDIDAWRKLI